MFGRRKLQNEVLELKYRVRELEQILCPFGSHDFKLIDRTVYVDPFDVCTIARYKCQKCGKEVTKDEY